MSGMGARMDQGKGESGSKTFLKCLGNSKSKMKSFLFHIYRIVP